MSDLKTIWSKFKCDRLDESDQFWRVEAWLGDSIDEESSVIALIDDTVGNVIYVDDRARYDRGAQEVIHGIVLNIRVMRNVIFRDDQIIFIRESNAFVFTTDGSVMLTNEQGHKILEEVQQIPSRYGYLNNFDLEFMIANVLEDNGLVVESVAECSAVVL